MTTITVQPTGTCGAAVSDVDLARLTVSGFDQIQAAFAEHGVLYFREQTLSERDHIQLAERFGPAVVDRTVDAHLDHPEIEEIIEGDATGTETDATGGPERWSAGNSNAPVPALGSVLVVREGPASGFGIGFASMYAAYDALATSTKERIENLRAVHNSVTHTDRPSTTAAHPVVIAHPLSGKKALFVNPTSTVGIVGMGRNESTELLRNLFDHANSDDFVHHRNLSTGSVVMWDNRAVWHRTAAPGVDGVRRVLHRVTIEGCELNAPPDHGRAEPTLVQKAGATLAGGVVAAAMDGIGIVIEPERTKRPDIEIVGEAPDDEPDTELDFGGLPPI